MCPAEPAGLTALCLRLGNRRMQRDPGKCRWWSGFRSKDTEGDLTNAQFPMLNSYPLRIEHWELSIGQIPFCLKSSLQATRFSAASQVHPELESCSWLLPPDPRRTCIPSSTLLFPTP